jgi:hypothetical protein
LFSGIKQYYESEVWVSSRVKLLEVIYLMNPHPAKVLENTHMQIVVPSLGTQTCSYFLRVSTYSLPISLCFDESYDKWGQFSFQILAQVP